jgi:hypothetical protein
MMLVDGFLNSVDGVEDVFVSDFNGLQTHELMRRFKKTFEDWVRDGKPGSAP